MCIECAFIAFTLESGFGRCALDAQRVNPPLEVDWNRIGTEFIVYSSNNDKITHGYAPTNSNIVEAFASRPPYMFTAVLVCRSWHRLTRLPISGLIWSKWVWSAWPSMRELGDTSGGMRSWAILHQKGWECAVKQALGLRVGLTIMKTSSQA